MIVTKYILLLIFIIIITFSGIINIVESEKVYSVYKMFKIITMYIK